MTTRGISLKEHELPQWLKAALLSPVELFQLYRFFIALFFIVFHFTGSGPLWLGFAHPALFTFSAILYLGVVVANAVLARAGYISAEHNIPLIVFADILFITVLMHASGGVQTGLGILIAISITAGSLMMKGRLALLFASFAAVAIITEQLVTLAQPQLVAPDFVHSGMLGLAFFAIALLSHSLALHIQASEKLAVKTQKSLDNMAQLNEYIIGHMQQGVIAVGPEGQILLINQAAREMINLPRNTQETALASLCPVLAEKISSQPANRTQVFSPLQLDSSSAPVSQQVKLTLVPLGSGQTAGTLAFIEDLREITQQAQQLKLASIGRLTASIAHEIRNPLGAISHAGQLLDESAQLPAADRRLADIINKNADRMNQTIENVLKLSKRDSAQPRWMMAKPWLSELRTEVIQSTRLDPAQIIVSVIPDALEEYFDPLQMNQAMMILVNNAISHFDRSLSELQIGLKFQQAVSRNGTLLECVDNGPGISQDAMEHVFEPFYTSRPAGTGLGLYIARELVETNRAQITYLHNEPHGSIFRIFFNESPSRQATS